MSELEPSKESLAPIVDCLKARLDHLLGDSDIVKLEPSFPNYTEVLPPRSNFLLPDIPISEQTIEAGYASTVIHRADLKGVYIIEDTYPSNYGYQPYKVQDVICFSEEGLFIKKRDQNNRYTDYTKKLNDHDIIVGSELMSADELRTLNRRFEPQEEPKRVGLFSRVARGVGKLSARLAGGPNRLL